MIKRYAKDDQLNKVNQTDAMNMKGSGSARGGILKPFLSFVVGIVFTLFLIFFSSVSYDSTGVVTEHISYAAGKEIGITELSSTQNSGRVLREQNIATAEGVARITENTAKGRLLARRGALTDARRNLLILRRKLLNMPGEGGKVSGKIAKVRIHSERVEGSLYCLWVDVPLNKLMEGEIGIEQD